MSLNLSESVFLCIEWLYLLHRDNVRIVNKIKYKKVKHKDWHTAST